MKSRVKNILNYKKPKLIALLAAAAVCILVTVCFATETRSKDIQLADHMVTDPTMPSETNEAFLDNSASVNNHTIQEDRINAPMEHLTKWADAFCNRDGDAVNKMLDDDGKKSFGDIDLDADSHSFGWSSPWPWGTELSDEQPNFWIVSADDNHASILYYAWTSDPHVTVWCQTLSYRYDLQKDQFLINGVSLVTLDSIGTADEFYTAYPYGIIDHTRMDYYNGNGAGEALCQHSLLSSTNIYKILSNPGTAAVYLLNIQPSRVKTAISHREDETIVTFTFLQDNSKASVRMVQPYKSDIWIPQTDTKSEKFLSPSSDSSGIIPLAQTKTKNVYWLSGISKAAGGNMKMHYKNKNTITIKGKFRKSVSINGLADAEEKKQSYSLKVAANCKVVQVEADNNQTLSYASWAEGYAFEKGDEILFISAILKVKNDKVVKIYFSA